MSGGYGGTATRAAGALAVVVLSLPVAAQDIQGTVHESLAGPDTPVMVGGELDLDACFGVGLVTGPDPSEPHEAAVLTSPDPEQAVIDRVPTGRRVYLCEEHNGWTGVVYRLDGDLAGCGVSGPQERRRAYDGPCLSGWVASGSLSLAAG